ncbi:HD domain-containing protein [Candidatus Dojkabacteria bacterium]|uniref:HD domain-containing protein n=1 Tax=Candidatus Dojkabacteria bacterium TaxID=2099670 RepID=A0A3M0Z1Y6_9BACT|nr:MAG: HD domain-containing protein [Candidatus Dojkabacteria bacterium]
MREMFEFFKENIPDYVIEISKKLSLRGYKAFLVGGSVRDLLLHKIPNDYDVTTDAKPEEIMSIFEKSVPTGEKFGTITVIETDRLKESHAVEVTTFRSEENYVDGRWPSKVGFTSEIKTDLSRRDFTINAIALDLEKFSVALRKKENTYDIKEFIYDPFGGLQDLESKLIKAVGDPLERFSEDGLRSVRGCRLAAQLGFIIEENTKKAMTMTLHITQKVSIERFRDELLKLLYKSPKPSVGFNCMKEVGILAIFLPELLDCVGIVQPEFHSEDVYDHTMSTIDIADDRVKLAALFHDIGKPRTKVVDENGIHFYGHDIVGAEMTREIMKRLKFSNAETENTALLVRYHMFNYPSADWRKNNLDLNGEGDHGWSDGAVRRLIRNVGGDDQIEKLLLLRLADATSNKKSKYDRRELTLLSERISQVRAKSTVMTVSDLAISGKDLIREFNLQPSKIIGDILKYLLEIVLDDPILNQRETLLKLVKEYLNK